jgi:spermidine/putrescine transport system permease protein
MAAPAQDWKASHGVFAAIATAPIFWLILFFIVPMAVMVGYSFGENTGPITIDQWTTFKNYGRAIEPLYLGIFAKSAAVAALTTLICLILGFPVALAITFAQPKWRPWLLLAIMLPFWTNLLIRTYALIALLRTQGFANQAMGGIWDGTSWLKTLVGLQPLGDWEPFQLLYNNFAVILGLVYVHLPFMVLPLYSALDRLDKSLIEASLDLGASQLRTMLRIVAPLAAPGIISGVAITFIPALGAYLTPDLMGGTDSQMIANVIERQFKRANDWPFGAALSLIPMYLLLIALLLRGWMPKKAGVS